MILPTQIVFISEIKMQRSKSDITYMPDDGAIFMLTECLTSELEVRNPHKTSPGIHFQSLFLSHRPAVSCNSGASLKRPYLLYNKFTGRGEFKRLQTRAETEPASANVTAGCSKAGGTWQRSLDDLGSRKKLFLQQLIGSVDRKMSPKCWTVCVCGSVQGRVSCQPFRDT